MMNDPLPKVKNVKPVVCRSSCSMASFEEVAATKHEEWTSTKKVVNHKSRQVETRVQRQIMYEDGKEVGDSGPQLITKTTEDNHKEETENTDYRVTGGDDLILDDLDVRASNLLVTKNILVKHTIRENKEESKQLHEESFQGDTDSDILNKILADHSDGSFKLEVDFNKSVPEKHINYFCCDQKVTDKENIKEVSGLKNGELITETSRIRHYEDKHENLENEAYEVAMSEISTEISKNSEYCRDRLDNTGISQEREQNILRRDSFTKAGSDIEKEEKIRNCEATRWLKHQFGSDSRSEFEPSQTKQTKNVIHVQFTDDSKILSRTQFDKECVKTDLTFPQGSEEENKYPLSKETKTKHFLGISEWDSKPRKFSQDQTLSLSSYKESVQATPPAGLGKDNFNYILSNYQLNSPRQGSSRQISHHIPWKSKSFVRDENNTTLEEEDTAEKNRKCRLEVFHSENQTHDNGCSDTEVPRNLTVSEESMPPKSFSSTGNFCNSLTLHILPQNTRFTDESHTTYLYPRMQSSPETVDKADRFVQVNLLDDASYPTSSPNFSEECGIHTPLKTSSANLYQEQKQVVAVRMPRTYYFGDELNVNYREGAKSKTHEFESVGEDIDYEQLSNINNSNFGNPVGSYTVEKKDGLKKLLNRTPEELNVGDLNNSYYYTGLDDSFQEQCHEDTRVASDVSQGKGSYHHSCYDINYGDESDRKDTEKAFVNNESSCGLYEKQEEFTQNIPDHVHPSNDVMQMSITTNYISKHQRRNSPPSISEDDGIFKDSRTPYVTKIKETSTCGISSSSQIESSVKHPLCPTLSPPVEDVFVCNTLSKYFQEDRPICSHSYTPGTTVTSFKAMSNPLGIKNTCPKTTATFTPNHESHEENMSLKTSRRPQAVLVEVRDWNNR
ncbi:uncharacterized protein LOC143237667 isoform X2 [Tachypleus tridentatus]|uniref:uncharacterized protein LOC143237667 isoform X2 n=1 Tax=Tachypleus tridentatus TaxID=6853 RepID=UPI003FD0BB1F